MKLKRFITVSFIIFLIFSSFVLAQEKKELTVEWIYSAESGQPSLDPAEFGIFAGAAIVDDGELTTVTVPLGKQQTITVQAPTPIVAAWATDNIAGKILADAQKSKVK